MQIVKMTGPDFELFWPIFREIVRAEDTYAFDPDISYEQARSLWLETPTATYVAREGDTVLGSYYLKPNAAGPGSHVCNCGYMVSRSARGKGVARRLCLHSQDIAKTHGYTAMQFNSVVSTNEAAVALWKKLDFEVVGTLPGAFKHKQLGFVDSLVMFKALV
ncbi:GNAT family N-acetyltransferase [Marinobacter fonticola]|uniref:GNAT family N-acetyltransferase n=1 Tax=Marinobacter fonticola TaxID=2603215 RepID=UPI0011E83007|nr:GNAT family N-acetyltransferase [Marinobacter fonticola]